MSKPVMKRKTGIAIMADAIRSPFLRGIWRRRRWTDEPMLI